MIKNIIQNCKNTLFLIAYSGGLDSTVLLHQMFLIKKYDFPNIQIRAIHINHNISSDSNLWLKHCQKKCKVYNIPFISENIFIDKKRNNIEEKLRIKRYQIIYKHLLNHEILLTGHHLNDQCETLILFLKRGSGPTGLAGIEFERSLGKKKIIRPLLKKTRDELKSWAICNQLTWIEDNSNLDITYDRNFIRHEIIPIFKKRWPYFLKNCAHTANICRKETILLNQFLNKEIKKYLVFDTSLNIQDFKKINQIQCQSMIRYWISFKTEKTPSYKIIQNIYYQMIYSRIDANPKIVLNKHEIRRYKNVLYFIKKQPIIKNIILSWHDRNTYLNLPNQLGRLKKNNKGFSLPAPKKNELVNIRFQCEGKFLIIGRKKRRKIKKIWQEKNIPPWMRNQIPLLFYNNRFISALGVFVIHTPEKREKREKIWKISWENDIKLNEHMTKYFFI